MRRHLDGDRNGWEHSLKKYKWKNQPAYCHDHTCGLIVWHGTKTQSIYTTQCFFLSSNSNDSRHNTSLTKTKPVVPFCCVSGYNKTPLLWNPGRLVGQTPHKLPLCVCFFQVPQQLSMTGVESNIDRVKWLQIASLCSGIRNAALSRNCHFFLKKHLFPSSALKCPIKKCYLSRSGFVLPCARKVGGGRRRGSRAAASHTTVYFWKALVWPLSVPSFQESFALSSEGFSEGFRPGLSAAPLFSAADGPAAQRVAPSCKWDENLLQKSLYKPEKRQARWGRSGRRALKPVQVLALILTL